MENLKQKASWKREANKRKKQSNSLIFFSLLESVHLPIPAMEHKFDVLRMWRFDYAWLSQKVALEVEGGVFTNGRHSRGAGMVGDMDKYNTAVILGWRIIRVTPSQLNSAKTIQLIKQLI